MATNSKQLKPLDIPFKEFMPGQVIQSVQFNDDMRDIEDTVNELVNEHNIVSTELSEHVDNLDNPHQVDAHQTGTYNATEIDEFFQDVRGGNLDDNAITNRVLDDECVDTRNYMDNSITASKLDISVGNQIDISQNISIADKYTKDETDELIRSKVGEGTYSREELDVKFEQVQAGQIVENSIGVEKLKNNVGTMLDISNNASITNKYTKAEVNALILKNGLPKDWGDLSPIVEDDGNIPDIPENGAFNLSSLPICDIMVAGDFKATVDDILDLKIKEVVESRGGMPSLNDRISSISEKADNVNDTILTLNREINNLKSSTNLLHDNVSDLITDVESIMVSHSDHNLSQNGYKYLPGGLLIQWGHSFYKDLTKGQWIDKTINLPISFRTCFTCIVTCSCNDRGGNRDLYAMKISNDESIIDSFDASIKSDTPSSWGGISWFAIGM